MKMYITILNVSIRPIMWKHNNRGKAKSSKTTCWRATALLLILELNIAVKIGNFTLINSYKTITCNNETLACCWCTSYSCSRALYYCFIEHSCGIESEGGDQVRKSILNITDIFECGMKVKVSTPYGRDSTAISCFLISGKGS